MGTKSVWWFDDKGKHVDGQLIAAQQGQLFTVIHINKSSENRNGDLLMTVSFQRALKSRMHMVSPSLSSVGIFSEFHERTTRQIWMTDLSLLRK